MTLEEYAMLRKMLRRDSVENHLRRQDEQMAAIRRGVEKNTWLADFTSNVAGNAVWDGLVWLFKAIRK